MLRCLTGWLLLLFAWFSLPDSAQGQVAALDLHPPQTAWAELHPFVEVFPQAPPGLTIEQVLSPAYQSRFAPAATAFATPEKTAFTVRPGATPLPTASMTARNGVPISTSPTSGAMTSPTTVVTMVPGDSGQCARGICRRFRSCADRCRSAWPHCAWPSVRSARNAACW